jgi:hypothetical protein
MRAWHSAICEGDGDQATVLYGKRVYVNKVRDCGPAVRGLLVKVVLVLSLPYGQLRRRSSAGAGVALRGDGHGMREGDQRSEEEG